MKDMIQDILLESIQVKEDLLRTGVGRIKEISDMVIDALRKDGKVLIFGNGGSASDSQHIAAEFIGRFKKDRGALAAIALTTNTSVLTSLANDYGYDVIFAKQVEALGNKNDLVIAISTSGKAKNVIQGVKQAKKMNIKTADVSLVVPSSVTARIQEAHITISHIICEIVEQTLCQDQK